MKLRAAIAAMQNGARIRVRDCTLCRCPIGYELRSGLLVFATGCGCVNYDAAHVTPLVEFLDFIETLEPKEISDAESQ